MLPVEFKPLLICSLLAVALASLVSVRLSTDILLISSDFMRSYNRVIVNLVPVKFFFLKKHRHLFGVIVTPYYLCFNETNKKMKQFQATIKGTYITKVFKANNLTEAKQLAKNWISGIKNVSTTRFYIIELSIHFYIV